MCLLHVGSELRSLVKFVKSKVIALGATITYEPTAPIIQAAFVLIRNNNLNYSILLQHRHYCCKHRYSAKLCVSLYLLRHAMRVFLGEPVILLPHAKEMHRLLFYGSEYMYWQFARLLRQT